MSTFSDLSVFVSFSTVAHYSGPFWCWECKCFKKLKLEHQWEWILSTPFSYKNVMATGMIFVNFFLLTRNFVLCSMKIICFIETSHVLPNRDTPLQIDIASQKLRGLYQNSIGLCLWIANHYTS